MDNVNKVEGPQCSYKLYFKDIDKIVSQSGRVSSHHSDINQNSNGVWIFFFRQSIGQSCQGLRSD